MAAVICAEDSPPSFSIWSGLGHWGGVSSHEKGERGKRKGEVGRTGGVGRAEASLVF